MPDGRRVLVLDPTWPLDWAAEDLREAGVTIERAERPEGEDVVGLLVCPDVAVGAAELERLPRVEAVATNSTGFDNLDIEALAAAGVWCSNVAGYCTDEVAEHTVALVLALLRGVVELDHRVRAGEWDVLAQPPRRVAGAVLGVAGFGRIGQAVASRAHALGMVVVAYDPLVPAAAVRAAGAEHVASLPELLARSHCVTLHLPLSRETEGLVDAAALAAMRPGACLVNCARAGLVDQDALGEALRLRAPRRRGARRASGRAAASGRAGARLAAHDPEPPCRVVLGRGVRAGLPSRRTRPRARADRGRAGGRAREARAMTDVLVVGGGIVGVSVAVHCARRGMAVCLVESGPIAGEASSLELALLPASADASAYLELHHFSGGSFLLDRSLPEGWSARRIDARGAASALVQEARAYRVELRTSCEAKSLAVRRGIVRGVLTDDGELRAGTTVVAAGAASWRVCRSLGRHVPVRAEPVELLVTEPAPFELRAPDRGRSGLGRAGPVREARRDRSRAGRGCPARACESARARAQDAARARRGGRGSARGPAAGHRAPRARLRARARGDRAGACRRRRDRGGARGGDGVTGLRPDLVLAGGRIHTLAAAGTVSAVAIAGGRIVCVGGDELPRRGRP